MNWRLLLVMMLMARGVMIVRRLNCNSSLTKRYCTPGYRLQVPACKPNSL